MKPLHMDLILSGVISVTLFLLLRKSGNPVCKESIQGDLPVSNRVIKDAVSAGKRLRDIFKSGFVRVPNCTYTMRPLPLCGGVVERK